MPITFILLALSICSVWFPPIKRGRHFSMPIWPLALFAALCSGLYFGYLRPVGGYILVFMGGVAWLANRSTIPRPCRTLCLLASLICALALALHAMPGFHNPVFFSKVRLSPDTPPFTLYMNLDKACAGLFLLVFFCPRVRSYAQLKTVARKVWPIALATSAGVFCVALFLGYLRWDFKLSYYAPIFLANNLLLTCVAEEAFFRGLAQTQLKQLFGHSPAANAIGIFGSALLFGIAHLGGGIFMAALAALAGIGYAYAYAATQRIEAPIVAHFMLNALHFICFSYPHL